MSFLQLSQFAALVPWYFGYLIFFGIRSGTTDDQFFHVLLTQTDVCLVYMAHVEYSIYVAHEREMRRVITSSFFVHKQGDSKILIFPCLSRHLAQPLVRHYSVTSYTNTPSFPVAILDTLSLQRISAYRLDGAHPLEGRDVRRD